MSELSIGSGYTLEDVDKLTSFLIGIGSLQQADIINVLRVSYFNQNQTIEALQQSQWVSVNDSLPERHKVVSVQVDGFSESSTATYTENDGGEWVRQHCADDYQSHEPYFSDSGMAVIAWQALPTPPAKEQAK